jgi:hypothetical protein
LTLPGLGGRLSEMAPREWIRTIDRAGNNRLLYQLSYRGIVRMVGDITTEIKPTFLPTLILEVDRRTDLARP